jgi:putative endonuclease
MPFTRTEHLRTGATGEELAARWLENNGLEVLHRNWRHGRNEIDIVARDGRFLVVVEVKTRSSDRWGHPELAVDNAKQRKLMSAADALVHSIEEDLELRFDVLSITFTDAGPEFFHIPNAFYPTLNEQAT